MSITDLMGSMLGLEEAQRIEGFEPSLAAAWAADAPAWLFFGCLGLTAAAVFFYARWQRRTRVGVRAVLAVCRAAVLSLLLLLLAEPVLTVTVTSPKRPALWFLFDGTDSMAMVDQLPDAARATLARAVGLSKDFAQEQTPESAGLSRADFVKALVRRDQQNLFLRLAREFRLRAFLFDRGDGVRSLELSPGGRQQIDGKHLAAQLTADGEVSALGAALRDLARRHATTDLAGLVILSDFNQNTGPAAVSSARQLGVEIHTVGIGATTAVDLAVEIQAPLHVKKDERCAVEVTLRQQGLDGESVRVTLRAERLGTPSGPPALAPPVSEKTVQLAAAMQTVELPYVPERAGRVVLIAEVESVAGEVVEENNRARREINITDEFLRLLFVEYEPTWEWRFIKEVFHRDKLVTAEGFRTFLRSSDPRVRQSDAMFLPTMSAPRSEFFANDVIFLGDLPAAALSPRFCQMTEEFVRNFGGGLVVLCGPRFGPGQLAETPLARLLPVKVHSVKIDPGGRLFDREAFRLRLAPAAAQYDFMQLGSDEAENRKAWDNLGPLPWYQPAVRLHPLATVLAEHPEHTCVDGRTRQPLIAVRRYGRGEVIYLAFNEMWRLRRRYGEQYYRQFWGQMIHRLGLSHALGSQKRFVVRTDRRRYQADDEVLLSVEAYDADFQPLAEDDLPQHRLDAELILPTFPSVGDANPPPNGRAAQQNTVGPLSVTQLREGVFEARLPVYTGGEHRIRVTDPVTGQAVETAFQVTRVAVERQRAVRNVALQRAIAEETGGVSCDLTNVADLADRIERTVKIETSVEVISLWNTWLSFACVVGLLLGEWLLRKRVNLP